MPSTTQIGLGLAAIGRPHYINIRQENAPPFDYQQFYQTGSQFIEDAYHAGIRYFDTAPGYGIAEQMLINWLKEKKPTLNVEVASKWGYTYTANFDLHADKHEVKEHSIEKLEEQWEATKQLLPYLSVYQIHSATFETGVLDNPTVLNHLFELKNTFNIEIGLTSTGDNQADVLEKAQRIKVGNQPLFTAFQVTYNLFDQSTYDICQRLIQDNKKVILKEALANGRVFPNIAYPHYQSTYDYLTFLSKKYNVGVDAIALRFCIQAPFTFRRTERCQQLISPQTKSKGTLF